MLIEFEDRLDCRPRYTDGPNPHLYRVLNEGRARYEETLRGYLSLADDFASIPLEAPAEDPVPRWNNPFFTGTDAMSLYAMLTLHRPGFYVEVGSGNSTRFARRAIQSRRLATDVVSIDPEPRLEIDGLCDRIIRKPLEQIAPEWFDMLQPRDFLFVDSSHRCFMNSDVTVIMLDILPRLKPGVFVHFHDIFLPYDYPEEMSQRYYSEQYLLACYLLAGGRRFQVEAPVQFIYRDPELSGILGPVWQRPEIAPVQMNGGSFWIRML